MGFGGEECRGQCNDPSTPSAGLSAWGRGLEGFNRSAGMLYFVTRLGSKLEALSVDRHSGAALAARGRGRRVSLYSLWWATVSRAMIGWGTALERCLINSFKKWELEKLCFTVDPVDEFQPHRKSWPV